MARAVREERLHWDEPHIRQAPVFDESGCGVNRDELRENCSVMDAFNAVFDRQFFNILKTETNRLVHLQMIAIYICLTIV